MVETLDAPVEVLDEPFCPKLSKKQLRVLNCKSRIMLLVGPRKTGKSVAVGHKVCRHLWDAQARVGLFVTSYKAGTHGGSWQDLVELALPQWLNSGIVSDDGANTFEYATVDSNGKPGPKLDGKTRTPYFEIKNRHGTTSSCTLYSIDNENEIEAKAKQLNLSMVWVIELSTFGTRDIFRLTLLCLRWGEYEDRQWISDTNPSDEGTESWIYKTFYTARNNPELEKDEYIRMAMANVEVIEIYLEDNPFLRPEEIGELKWTYADDPDGYARHVEGKWKKSTGRRGWIFADVLIESIHFIKDAIDVHKDTSLLYTGWDPGIFNSAALVIERRFIDDYAFFFVLDELVATSKEISIADFTVAFFEKLVVLNDFYKKTWVNFEGFQWEHWSDPNVQTLSHPSMTGVISAEVTKITKGQVELNCAIKGAGSIASGCQFIRRLLREQRIFIGENCPNLIEALKSVKHAKSDYMDADDKFKHVLDALRYPVTMLSIDEVEGGVPTPLSSSRRILHVRL